MAEELSYVLVTPYSIRKSRTGGIIARLISRTGLDLAAARMFAPSAELIEKYSAGIVTDPEPRHRRTQLAGAGLGVDAFLEPGQVVPG